MLFLLLKCLLWNSINLPPTNFIRIGIYGTSLSVKGMIIFSVLVLLKFTCTYVHAFMWFQNPILKLIRVYNMAIHPGCLKLTLLMLLLLAIVADETIQVKRQLEGWHGRWRWSVLGRELDWSRASIHFHCSVPTFWWFYWVATGRDSRDHSAWDPYVQNCIYIF